MKTRRQLMFIWVLALAIISGPVAAHAHALSHLPGDVAVSDGKHGHGPGGHARAACEGAYANLGHALAAAYAAAVVSPAPAGAPQPLSILYTGRHSFPYLGRAPPPLPG